MTFHKQLTIGHLMSVMLIVVIAVVAIAALRVTSAGEGAIASTLAEDLARVQRLRFQAEEVVSVSRGYLLTGEGAYRAKFEAVSAELEAGLGELRGRVLDPEGGRRAKDVENAARAYTDAATVAARERSKTDAPHVVPYFDQIMKPRRDALEASIAAFGDHERGVFDAALGEIRARARDAQIAVLLTAILAIMLGLALARTAVRRLGSQFDRLRAAQEVAKAAADAREELLAVVSHDLRNPLTSIVAGAAVLDETAADDGARRRARIVRRAADRMTHMIDELLETARFEAGTIVLHRGACEAKRVIEETLELFDTCAAERAIQLRAECGEASVVGDHERLVEVLSNLIGNALKFTPPGGEIVVKVDQHADAVRFVVADTGPGVPPEQIPHLFDRYWQGADHREGLGLGLYICKKLVEAHHGAIGVNTRVGKRVLVHSASDDRVNDPGGCASW